MTGEKPTIRELKAALEKFPEDAVWWPYEGELVGIIVSHETGSGVIFDDGTVEWSPSEAVKKEMARENATKLSRNFKWGDDK